jgi:hypothetical protein
LRGKPTTFRPDLILGTSRTVALLPSGEKSTGRITLRRLDNRSLRSHANNDAEAKEI